MPQQAEKSDKIEFRKEALDNFSASDRTDQILQVTTAKSWIMLATFGGLVIALLVWGFCGTITIWVEGQGMLLPEKGRIYSAVAPSGPGHIQTIKVQAKDHIRKGEIIAVLENPTLTKQVDVTRDYVANLQQRYEEEKNLAATEIADRQATLKQQNQTTQRILATERENLVHTEKLLKMRKEFLEKKLITNQNYYDTLNRSFNIKNQIERAQEQLLQNELNAESFIDNWKERLKALDTKIRDEELELHTMEEKLKLSQHVKSPVDGIIIGVRKSVGEVVQEGDALMNIATEGEGMEAMIYLAPRNGKRVKANMGVLVSPTTIKREEYGSIKGMVTYVSSFPVTSHAMLAILQNEELVKRFAEKGAPIAVRVRLQRDPETFSRLQWSSSKGPEQEITPGTLMTARVTVRTQSPFSLVIPALKKVIAP